MSPSTTLPTRQLGRNGPAVTALGFGLMGLSGAYGEVPSDEERLEFLDKVYDAGQTFWDSADMYADSEDLVGKWFARTGKRDEIFLATKFANIIKDGQYSVRSDPEYVKEACAKSLKRLGIETIDLYYCHRLDTKTPIEETVKAMVELKNEGKVKYLGLSECSARSIRRAHAVHPISAVQIEYSPFALDIEHNDVLNTCTELGIALISYSPLGRGMLTGAFKSPDDFPAGDFRRVAPRFSVENFPNNIKLVDKITELANKKGCTSGQLALAWLLRQGTDGNVIPIPGTKKEKYMRENLGALGVDLSDEEVKEVREASEKAEVRGERYPEGRGGTLFADTPELGS